MRHRDFTVGLDPPKKLLPELPRPPDGAQNGASRTPEAPPGAAQMPCSNGLMLKRGNVRSTY